MSQEIFDFGPLVTVIGPADTRGPAMVACAKSVSPALRRAASRPDAYRGANAGRGLARGNELRQRISPPA
jgi:hypothetical protein